MPVTNVLYLPHESLCLAFFKWVRTRAALLIPLYRLHQIAPFLCCSGVFPILIRVVILFLKWRPLPFLVVVVWQGLR